MTQLLQNLLCNMPTYVLIIVTVIWIRIQCPAAIYFWSTHVSHVTNSLHKLSHSPLTHSLTCSHTHWTNESLVVWIHKMKWEREWIKINPVWKLFNFILNIYSFIFTHHPKIHKSIIIIVLIRESITVTVFELILIKINCCWLMKVDKMNLAFGNR